ncbi:uncharacterized protein EAF02_004722 [Botrytis sinoallii]|uniref:uncharacterized protein n=1 Tax=Botrytis sinoallii TaxID=1463999 RepID=UPI0018FF12FE|nr:uncharacterized protein EAF02_004722 [Botrytis sinoallii]KAF7884386.1 hypothetical protein EAF02_004722 [Botrytis sinoallii]
MLDSLNNQKDNKKAFFNGRHRDWRCIVERKTCIADMIHAEGPGLNDPSTIGMRACVSSMECKNKKGHWRLK